MDDKHDIVLLEDLSSIHEAQVVKQLLEAEGIPSLIKGKKKRTRYDLAFGALGLSFGECSLYVPRAFLKRARGVLEDAREAGRRLDEWELEGEDEEDES